MRTTEGWPARQSSRTQRHNILCLITVFDPSHKKKKKQPRLRTNCVDTKRLGVKIIGPKADFVALAIRVHNIISRSSRRTCAGPAHSYDKVPTKTKRPPKTHTLIYRRIPIWTAPRTCLLPMLRARRTVGLLFIYFFFHVIGSKLISRVYPRFGGFSAYNPIWTCTFVWRPNPMAFFQFTLERHALMLALMKVHSGSSSGLMAENGRSVLRGSSVMSFV